MRLQLRFMRLQLTFLALVSCLAVYAQVNTSTIAGAVVDETGSAVPNAKVVTTIVATGQQRETQRMRRRVRSSATRSRQLPCHCHWRPAFRREL